MSEAYAFGAGAGDWGGASGPIAQSLSTIWSTVRALAPMTPALATSARHSHRHSGGQAHTRRLGATRRDRVGADEVGAYPADAAIRDLAPAVPALGGDVAKCCCACAPSSGSASGATAGQISQAAGESGQDAEVGKLIGEINKTAQGLQLLGQSMTVLGNGVQWVTNLARGLGAAGKWVDTAEDLAGNLTKLGDAFSTAGSWLSELATFSGDLKALGQTFGEAADWLHALGDLSTDLTGLSKTLGAGRGWLTGLTKLAGDLSEVGQTLRDARWLSRLVRFAGQIKGVGAALGEGAQWLGRLESFSAGVSDIAKVMNAAKWIAALPELAEGLGAVAAGVAAAGAALAPVVATVAVVAAGVAGIVYAAKLFANPKTDPFVRGAAGAALAGSTGFASSYTAAAAGLVWAQADKGSEATKQALQRQPPAAPKVSPPVASAHTPLHSAAPALRPVHHPHAHHPAIWATHRASPTHEQHPPSAHSAHPHGVSAAVSPSAPDHPLQIVMQVDGKAMAKILVKHLNAWMNTNRAAGAAFDAHASFSQVQLSAV